MTDHTRKRPQPATPIRLGSRLVAHVKDGVLRKRIAGHRHMLSDPPAIAFADAILVDAIRAGAQVLEVTDVVSGRIYRADLAHFKKHCFQVQRGAFEHQWAMRLEQWTVTEGTTQRRSSPASHAPPTPAPAPVKPEPKPTPTQLNLFR